MIVKMNLKKIKLCCSFVCNQEVVTLQHSCVIHGNTRAHSHQHTHTLTDLETFVLIPPCIVYTFMHTKMHMYVNIQTYSSTHIYTYTNILY